jgi:UDP-glucose 4-epimerase
MKQSLKNKNVLVTGGAGFIGSHLIDRIIKENPANLIVVDNFFLGREENLLPAQKNFPDLNVIRMDASDFSSMLQIVNTTKVDIVFNLAVVPLPTSLTFPTWTIEQNVNIASSFCELLRLGNFQTLVHCSSSEAYGTAIQIPMSEQHPLLPCTPYAASKVAGDHIVLSYCETYNVDAVIVRPFNNYGPRQNPGNYAGIIPIVVKRFLRNIPIEIFDDGEQTRDYIYVKDTVEAMVKIYNEELTRGQIINVSSGKEISINSLVNMMLSILGDPDFPVVHAGARAGDVRRHCGDVSRLKELTGFEPNSITGANLKETIDWYLRILK